MMRRGFVAASVLVCASCIHRQPALTPVSCPPLQTPNQTKVPDRVTSDRPMSAFTGPYTLVVDGRIAGVIRDEADSIHNARVWRSIDATTIKYIEVIPDSLAQQLYPRATGGVLRITRCYASDWSASISPPKPPVPPWPRFIARQTDSAGVIHGIVRDSADKPIAEARVAVLGTTISTFSDSMGRFRLVVPPGKIALRTLRVGYVPGYDSVTIGRGHGADVEIRLGWHGIYIDSVCACDPVEARAVTLNFHWRRGDEIPFAIVTTRDSGRVIRRDSIPGAEFTGDSLSRVVLRQQVNLGAPRLAVTSIEVSVPGHRPWRRDLRTLPVTLEVMLERNAPDRSR